MTNTAHVKHRTNPDGTSGAVPNSTRMSGLTPLNTRALREHWRHDKCHAEFGTTVATFHAAPADVLAMVVDLANELAVRHGRSGHPVQSLHAISRKLFAWIDAQN